MTVKIKGLSEIAHSYQAILCDVWGVLHNGVSAWQSACEALAAFRKTGGVVVLITNAPRPNGPVIAQLDALGVSPDTYDAVDTSGDVTRSKILEYPEEIFHLGPKRDRTLFDGMNREYLCPNSAKSVVCTGLFDDEKETPEDYADILQRCFERNLPFICANPDIVVERGDRLIWCAGALARDYAALGGETVILGKPHAPIYEHALRTANKIAGKEFELNQVLAIGDGMPTDVKGAKDNGIDLLYVSAGIHAAEYGAPDNPDPEKLDAFLQNNDAKPVATLPRLKW